MSMRNNTLLYALLLTTLTATACQVPRPVRNVILITIDTLRADHLGAYGHTGGLSPNLDALAREATLFENASTPIPLTGPAHSSILTGRYPLVTGVRNNGTTVLHEDERLLSEILKENGFRTAAVVSSLVLDSRFGFDQGFDLYYEEDITSTTGRGMWFSERKADMTVDRALQWVEAQSEHPFFLWMHLFDPHHPYNPPGLPDGLPPGERYAREIAFVDREVGRFFDALKRLSLWDSSFLVVAGDHGESLGEHNEMYHGVFVYESTMHVPLIMRHPAYATPRRVSDQVTVIDIFPTVLDAVGVPSAGIRQQGITLMDAVIGRGDIPARGLFFESIYGSTSFGWAEVSAVKTPQLKFIDLPSPELYDLDADPHETENLASRDGTHVTALREKLREVRSPLQAVMRTDIPAAALDDEMRDRLLSLGYISGRDSIMRRGTPRDPKEVSHLAGRLTEARRLRRSGEAEAAEEILRDVLRQDPENKMALMSLGRLLASEGRTDEAEVTLRRALATYPDAEEFYRVLGWMLIHGDRKDEAIELFKSGLEQAPRSAVLLYMFGFANFRAERWASARDALNESLILNSDLPKAHYLVGVCQEMLGDRDGAYAAIERYLELEPDVESLFRDPYLEELRQDPRYSELIKRFL